MSCCGKKAWTSSPDSPILLGEPDAGSGATRARTTIGLGGVPAGEEAWFTGSDVAALVAQGLLVVG